MNVENEVKWTGTVSNDWFDYRNWIGGLPSESVNAIISRTAVRMPIIDPVNSTYAQLYSNTAAVKDLTINASASLSMKNNTVLTVSRNWINYGEFYPNTGTVIFNGNSHDLIQHINFESKDNEAFFNLVLNNSNGAKGIALYNKFKLIVLNNLILLNGDLRLLGESQLIQKADSNYQNTSGFGNVLVDQQGNASSYNYNLWSSPVTSNGYNYSIGSVLRDGTNSENNPFNQTQIDFNSDVYYADGVLTSPIRLSTTWMFKHSSVSATQSEWLHIGSTGIINPGEGFSMKGVTGTETNNLEQNYAFVGKPNNGTYPIPLLNNQSYLMGNPYPCSLDADEFIKDNIKDGLGRASTNLFNGALYFWNHFGNQTHTLNQYIGGFSCYTLMGGISSNFILPLNNTSSIKTPQRFIPIGQGFIIRSTPLNSTVFPSSPIITGGTIKFKNSQRAFVTESENNSVFVRSTNLSNTTDTRQRIRLSLENQNVYKRQIMVGVDENATNSFDVGYDAPFIDSLTDDLYWNINNSKFIIQAVSNFDNTQLLPMIIKTSSAGLITLKIETIDNVPASTDIFVYDSVTGLSTSLKEEPFSTYLLAGEYLNRFSIKFHAAPLSNTEFTSDIPSILFANSSNTLIVNNIISPLKYIEIYTATGQKSLHFDLKDNVSSRLEIPLNELSNGIYFIKTQNIDNKTFTKKIIK